jgi:hypothetical protein
LQADFDSAMQMMIIKAPDTTHDDRRDFKVLDTLQHEMFIGLFGTNQLRSAIPNYAYIYGGFRCQAPRFNTSGNLISWCGNNKVGNNKDDTNNLDYVIYENVIPSESIEEYCRKCQPKDFLNIFLQICYALDYGLRVADFTHYDLHAGNVLIRAINDLFSGVNTNSNNYYDIEYSTENGKEYISTNVISTIIDYGRAHIRYRDENFGVYDFQHLGISPNRPFIMYDVYKLFGYCIYSMWYDNKSCYEHCKKILDFFSDLRDPTLTDAQFFDSQAEKYFNLPPNDKYLNMSVLELTKYIRSIFPHEDLDFIHKDQREVVFNCTLGGCLSEKQISEKIVVGDKTRIQKYTMLPPRPSRSLPVLTRSSQKSTGGGSKQPLIIRSGDQYGMQQTIIAGPLAASSSGRSTARAPKAEASDFINIHNVIDITLRFKDEFDHLYRLHQNEQLELLIADFTKNYEQIMELLNMKTLLDYETVESYYYHLIELLDQNSLRKYPPTAIGLEEIMQIPIMESYHNIVKTYLDTYAEIIRQRNVLDDLKDVANSYSDTTDVNRFSNLRSKYSELLIKLRELKYTNIQHDYQYYEKLVADYPDTYYNLIEAEPRLDWYSRSYRELFPASATLSSNVNA